MASSEDFQSIYELYKQQGIPKGKQSKIGS